MSMAFGGYGQPVCRRLCLGTMAFSEAQGRDQELTYEAPIVRYSSASLWIDLALSVHE
jgi:hypothetical protein